MSTSLAGERIAFRSFRPAALPSVWRDLDVAVWQWVIAHGGHAEVALAAGWASFADGQGHSALPLDMTLADGTLPLEPRQVDVLKDSDWVADLSQTDEVRSAPFILDGSHFFLRRNFLQETAVASMLVQLQADASSPRSPLSEKDLRVLFGHDPTEAELPQARAVTTAVGRRLMVLTGGPGTGKTTTVLRMLLALSREGLVRTGQLPLIRVAAPTGKAAQRLSESLRSGATSLRGSGQPLPQEWQHHLDNVLQAESGTVHRMLGSLGALGGYRHSQKDPLPADIIVVDEASMLDLGLLKGLLSALKGTAVLVLVGDADQLTSVGTGSVLMDLVSAMEGQGSEALVRLAHCFRADSLLVPINESVRRGDLDAFDHACQAANSAGRFEQYEVLDRTALRRRLGSWARRMGRAMESAGVHNAIDRHDAESLAAAMAVLKQQQLLCALREGPFGAIEADQTIAVGVRAAASLDEWEGEEWYPGRPVMITRNDTAARLFNGDVGICLRIRDETGERLQVAFEAESGDQGLEVSRVRLFDPNTLPPYEGAFALTVHKSQGSEYGRVALLLPPETQSPILTRQLLYTALSRAKDSIEIWGARKVIERGTQTRLQRHGGLAGRIGFTDCREEGRLC